MPEHIFRVEPQTPATRLDVFLAEKLEGLLSRTRIKRLIDKGEVLVNGRPLKAHHKVAAGDEILLPVAEPAAPPDILPENIPLDIFYEDDYLLVVNKPGGMLVHPALGKSSGTLVNALLYYCQNRPGTGLSSANTSERPGIVHRLDRETSGLMVVAKDNVTHGRLARQFERHRVKKRYIALVKGTMEFDEGLIDAAIGRHPLHREKKSVAYDQWAKEAVTVYHVRERFAAKATLVALFPQSGRTHQLRVHMAHIGHPILGDDKYGEKGSFPRLALHSQSIGFTHPHSKSFVEFSTPVPAGFLRPNL